MGWNYYFQNFEKFKSSYKKIYFEYHKKLYPEEYYAEIASVRDLSEFKMLQYLSEIELISVKNDFIRIQNIINNILTSQCKK